MKNTLSKGLVVKFDKVIKFEQHDTTQLECFFFKDGELVGSKFLTTTEFDDLK